MKTAVEQFINDLQEHFPNHMNSIYNNNQLLLEQLTLKAKQMEKEQIIDSFNEAIALTGEWELTDGKKYYNETYNSERIESEKN